MLRWRIMQGRVTEQASATLLQVQAAVSYDGFCELLPVKVRQRRVW